MDSGRLWMTCTEGNGSTTCPSPDEAVGTSADDRAATDGGPAGDPSPQIRMTQNARSPLLCLGTLLFAVPQEPFIATSVGRDTVP